MQSEFIAKLTLTGGGADNLNTLLVAAGLTMQSIYSMTLQPSTSNSDSIYFGNASNVTDSNGFEVQVGTIIPIRGARPNPINMVQYYIYAAITQKVEVWLHGN